MSMRSKIGVMPQDIAVWEDLTVYENLRCSAVINGVSMVDVKSEVRK